MHAAQAIADYHYKHAAVLQLIFFFGSPSPIFGSPSPAPHIAIPSPLQTLSQPATKPTPNPHPPPAAPMQPPLQPKTTLIVAQVNGRIEYLVTPFWKQKYCGKHDGSTVPRCCSCNKLKAFGQTWLTLSDQRMVCQDCSKSVVHDTEEAQPLYADVRLPSPPNPCTSPSPQLFPYRCCSRPSLLPPSIVPFEPSCPYYPWSYMYMW